VALRSIQTILAVLLFGAFALRAQPVSMTVLGVDTSAFPVVSARLFIYDADGGLFRGVGVGDFTVSEGGDAREVLDFSCADPRPPEPISAVLTIDVSGSMAGGPTSEPNIDIARAAATAWVNALPPGLSECAVTSFDHKNYLNQDFTTNRNKLRAAIDSLRPRGGTSYDAGLLASPGGGLVVASNGAYRRVVVFLTDGHGEGDEDAIVAAAAAENVVIYCVTLGMPMPQLLKDVAGRTGGGWFENVTSAAQAEQIYRTILRIVQGGEPCVLSWKSLADCSLARSATISIPALPISTEFAYEAPRSSVPALVADPPGVAFGPTLPGSAVEKDITLMAVERPVTIRSISTDNPRFTIVDGGAPPEFVLVPGEPHVVKIRFSPTDSSLSFADISILSDACSEPIVVASGGYPGRRPSEPTLRLTEPNGGERFVAGTEAVVGWRGVLPDDTVRLEYSTDAGATWLPIAEKATGFEYRWSVPATPSERCLARVVQIDTNGLTTIGGFGSGTRSVYFSDDGRYVVTGGDDKAATVREVATGKIVYVLMGHNSWVSSAQFSHDGTMILTTSDDQNGMVWNALTGALISVLQGHVGTVVSGDFSPDGRHVATVADDDNVVIWDPVTGNAEKTLTPAGYSSVRFSPDGRRVIVSEPFNGRATIWDVASETMLLALTGHAGPVFDAAYSPDGALAVTGSGDRTAKIWDALSGAELRTLSGHDGILLAVAFSPDGRTVVTGATDETVRIWDAATGVLLRTIPVGGFVRSVRYSPDGMHIYAGLDTSAVVIDLRPLQDDLSDSLWAIAVPNPRARDLDLGGVAVGSFRDSVVAGYICNDGTVPALVGEIRFTGAAASEFGLVSGVPPVTVPPGGCVPVEFHFAPAGVGVRSAMVEIQVGGDTLRYDIHGEGLESRALLATDFVDFGQVALGGSRDSIVTLAISNIGTDPISVEDAFLAGPDARQFEIVSGGGSFVLAPGEGRDLHLRFAPTVSGRTSGAVAFALGEGMAPVVVDLYGEGVCGDHVPYLTAELPTTLRAMPGDTIDIPLLLGSGGSSFVGSGDVAAEIRFNGTLLLPVDEGARGTLDGGDRVVGINGSRISGNDTVAVLRCIVGLGDADSTRLSIEGIAWEGCSAALDIRDGLLRVSGICDDGGTRLFLADGGLALKSVRPSPVVSTASIEYDLVEPGRTRLYVVDLLGARLATLVDEESTPGHHAVEFDASRLANGTYLYVLETPTRRLSRWFRVER